MITEKIDLTVKTKGYNSQYQASLSCYIPNVGITEKKEGGKRAVIVCPGGGYHARAAHEDEPIALMFATAGIAAFVLNYSVAPATFPQAVCEAAEAVSIVRKNAEKWEINPDKIAILGFSAGGHLAASLGVFYDKAAVLDNLGGSAEDYKPNGMVLCYPVVTGGEKAHRGSFMHLLGDEHTLEKAAEFSIENLVSETTPPAFIFHTFEDTVVPVENSLYLATAMAKHKVNCELHVFPHGNHGVALANGVVGPYNEEAKQWPELAMHWVLNY